MTFSQVVTLMAENTVAAQSLNLRPRVDIISNILHKFFEGFVPGGLQRASSGLVNSEKASD